MKKILPAILIFIFIGCFRNPTDHDLRVAAKKIIRKEFPASSSKPIFAPDDKIRIIREGDKTFYISLYTTAQNESGGVTRKEWNLHLLYKGGSLPNSNNWKVLQ